MATQWTIPPLPSTAAHNIAYNPTTSVSLQPNPSNAGLSIWFSDTAMLDQPSNNNMNMNMNMNTANLHPPSSSIAPDFGSNQAATNSNAGSHHVSIPNFGENSSPAPNRTISVASGFCHQSFMIANLGKYQPNDLFVNMAVDPDAFDNVAAAVASAPTDGGDRDNNPNSGLDLMPYPYFGLRTTQQHTTAATQNRVTSNHLYSRNVNNGNEGTEISTMR